ncbi:sucrose transporter, GPH family [Galdieria sulphuraria]|uniref:Sucrose transporter, GPH family n=1 Tax=Galdieria sulphuraria TaxID=130081 RepID=M2Y0T8_GALSU|nr:sucrose transporter, GPH family [Galdieria sulphuraria]EME29543.1 sucrose transporter, GPH family [Galdieria sulphuraria]|eukprot:XP_005706063.1 sucrose transporter, GPH family [Galdieria sulphuraria]
MKHCDSEKRREECLQTDEQTEKQFIYIPNESENLLTSADTSFENRFRRKRTTDRSVILVTLAFAGVECTWSIVIAKATPLFREMGVTDMFLSMFWLVGPIGGLVVQPVVGVLSDRCENPWGRRRPFIVVGAAFEVIGMFLLIFAGDLGKPFKKLQLQMGSEHSNYVSVFLAFLGLTCLSFAHNAIQGPSRALITDIVETERQLEFGNAMFAFWLGIGQATGYLAGSIDWTDSFWFVQRLESDSCHQTCVNLKVTGLVSIIMLLVCVGTSLYFAEEEPQCNVHTLQQSNTPNPLTMAIKFLFHLPSPIQRVCMVIFFSWFGYSMIFIHITDWVGKDIMESNIWVEDSLYDEGVRAGTIGLFFNSIISVLVSALAPWLVSSLGLRTLWFIGNGTLSLSLLSTPFIHDKWLAVCLIAFLGVPWAITMTVPYSLACVFSSQYDRAVVLGILNVYIVVPFLLCALFDGALMVVFGSVSGALVVGSCISLLGCYYIIEIPMEESGTLLSSTPSLHTFRSRIQDWIPTLTNHA